jgi:hypothetical protein
MSPKTPSAVTYRTWLRTCKSGSHMKQNSKLQSGCFAYLAISTRSSAPESGADSRRVRSLPHDASMRPLFSAAMVIALTCCLFALAYGIARLFHRLGLAAKTATQIVFGAAGGAALVGVIVGVIGIPVIVIGPALTRPWQVVAYFGWLGALSILAAGVLVPVCFKPR